MKPDLPVAALCALCGSMFDRASMKGFTPFVARRGRLVTSIGGVVSSP